MRKLSVDVFADTSRPEGGHAIIRLNGLDILPDNLTFRLRPVDSAQQGDGSWTNDERRPLVTRLTAAGAEIVVGPEIVENPVFLPGTLTAIEVHACGVRGEFLWPRIPPLMRPKRRHLIGAKPARETKPEPATAIAFGEAHDASSDVVPEAQSWSATPPADAAKATGGEPRPVLELMPGSELILVPMAGAAITPEPYVDVRDAELGPVPPPPATASDPPAALPEGDGKPDMVWSRESQVAASGWPRLATGLGLVGLLVLVAGYFWSAMAPQSPTALEGTGRGLIDLLSVGTTSPRGTRTRDKTASELIESADLLLHASGGKRDSAEAAFMLRRYLAATLSEERTLLALTQLGSIYAEPDGARAPDYARARQLWELSATLGDPVAMCFLASLHEYGYGTNANKPAALQWYLRARDAGGCKKLDEAIARVRK